MDYLERSKSWIEARTANNCKRMQKAAKGVQKAVKNAESSKHNQTQNHHKTPYRFLQTFFRIHSLSLQKLLLSVFPQKLPLL